MRLVFHGGECCGMKTIHGLGCNPNSVMEAAQKRDKCNADQFGQPVSSRQLFFTEEAPPETYKKRLDRLVDFCKRERPQGIIEITLAESIYNFANQVQIWGPLLRKRGFKCVNKCRNSNSGNTVHVFHKNCE